MVTMKNIAILGSTGFIGLHTLDVVARFPDQFKVVALAAGKNIVRLAEQIQQLRPVVAAVQDAALADQLRQMLPAAVSTSIVSNQAGMVQVATCDEVNLVVSAMVGASGLVPTMAAIQARKAVALANKETLVVAGRLIMEEAHARKTPIIPVDSEHSAIFQCLHGHRQHDVHRIVLTASGGPFLNYNPAHLAEITPEEALNHPVWAMGKKITIDSATLMNKGLEVIEARWLFDLPAERIDVVIHPQSIIHSMVEYCDGSVLAQLSIPDMRIPISYALAYPGRLQSQLPSLSLARIGKLTFFEPDQGRFPALRLAYQSLREKESMTAVLNGANEAAVEAFLHGTIRFSQIPVVIEKTMSRHTARMLTDIEDAYAVNIWGGDTAKKIIATLEG